MAEDKNFSPWGLSPLDDFVFDELKKRASSYGIDFDQLDNYDSSKYNGPRTAWVRVCSNGKIPVDLEKRKNPPKPDETPTATRDGFIMHGVNGFNDTYGFDDLNNSTKSILGYQVNGEPHVLEDNEEQTFVNRLGPGVTSIESEFYGAGSQFTGLCRKVTIKWRANSLGQLNYLMPYFLSPMMTVVVEWGWNNYNPKSLINLTDLGVSADPSKGEAGKGSGLRGYYTNGQLLQKKIEDSNGNYDAFIGRIIDFNFSLTSTGTFECSTVVVNTNYMLGGLSTFDTSTQSEETDSKKEAEILNFRKFVVENKDLDNIFDGDIFFKTRKRPEGFLKRLILGPKFDTIENRTDISDDLKKIVDSARETGKLFYAKSEKIAGTDYDTNITKKYIKFDVFVELVNYFYSKILVQGNDVAKINFLDIKETKICAHPLIKSTDDDVLIPNKYAPKIWKKSKNVGKNKQGGIAQKDIRQVVNTGYGKLLFDLGESIEKQLNDEDAELFYEDLDSIINSNSTEALGTRCFPQLTATTPPGRPDEGGGRPGGPPGYWGYLKDLYISTDLIKEELKNDKYIEFLTAILERINKSMVILSKFKIVPYDTSQNDKITIIDENYFNVNDPELKKVTEKPIIIGSVNSAFITNASLDVKLSPQVAGQTLFGNAVYDYRNKSKDDTKMMREGSPGHYVYTDRLFEKPAQTSVVETTTKEKQSQFNTDTNIKNFKHVQGIKKVTKEDLNNAEATLTRYKNVESGINEKIKTNNRKIKAADDKIEGIIRITSGRRFVKTQQTADASAEEITALNKEISKLNKEKEELEKELANAEARTKVAREERNFVSGIISGRISAGVTTESSSRIVTFILVENNYSLQQLFRDTQVVDENGDTDKSAMYIHNAIMPDTELSLEFLGIAGIRFLNTFTIDGVAEPYTYKKCIWQVDRVNHSVSGNNWKTSLVAKARPHRFFDKDTTKSPPIRELPAPSRLPAYPQPFQRQPDE